MSHPMDDEDAAMKGDHHDSARLALLSKEAAEWFVRLRDDHLSSRLRHHNVRWLKQSPAHIAELMRMQQIHKLLRAANVKDRSPTVDQQGAIAPNVIELSPVVKLPLRGREVQTDPEQSQPEPPFPALRGSSSRWLSWKVAASVAVLGLSLLFAFIVKVAWFDRSVETELGEWRVVSLSDGSTVRVGPGSSLRISFGDAHRTVRLVRGEAMFNVAKDPTRPFFVQSELVGVLALGTEFRVSRQGGEDVVAVTEGTVAVYGDGRDSIRGPVPESPASLPPESGAVAVTAGEQVSVSKSKPVEKQKLNVDYELAWADGWLTYEDKTIAEVAGEFNRRNHIKIVVDDPVVSARRLAFFRGRATDPESFVAALAADPEIVIVREEPSVLRVESSPEEPSAETSSPEGLSPKSEPANEAADEPPPAAAP